MRDKLLMEALDQVDEKLMTESTKKMIFEAFDKAVEAKAQEKMEMQLDVIKESTEDYLKQVAKSHVIDIQEKYDKAVEAKGKEFADTYLKELKESVEKQYEEEFGKIQANLSKYVKYVTEKFVEENKASWSDEVTVAKANSIMESASKFANDFGIELQNITNTDESKQALDESITEIQKLKVELGEMKRKKYIAESCKGMTDVAIFKIETLMEDFSIDDEAKFKERIDLLKSTLTVEKTDLDPGKGSQDKSKKVSWKQS